MTRKRIALALAAVAVIAFATGCTRVDLREEGGSGTKSVELGGAERVNVRLEMGAGDLTVGGGAGELMDAEFFFGDKRLEPEVDYDVTGSEGDLKVRQPGVHTWFPWWSNYRNTWDISLDESVPMDARMSLGAGDVTLDLGELCLENLTIDAGAGSIEVDLSGSRCLEDFSLDAGAGEISVDFSGNRWERDLDAQVTTGAGELNLVVPADVPVRLRIEGGIGENDVRGMTSDGEHEWVNDAYKDRVSGPTLTLDIRRGAGQVTVETR